MATKRNNEAVYKLVITAIFMAIVVVVQLFLGGITVSGVSFSLVLVPIVIGGALIGKIGGTILGFTFGIITLINGLIGVDPFTSFLLHNTGTKGAIVTAAVCLVKATLAGFVSALIYSVLKNINQYLAVILAAIAAPIVNTGVFVLVMIFVLSEELTLTMQALANINIAGIGIANYVILSLSGINFVVEFIVNAVLSPAIYSIVKAVKKGNI